LAALATIAANRTVSALSGKIATPAHTATALTAGYTLAFGIAAGLLLVTAAVAVATLPSQRAISQRAIRQPAPAEPELLAPELELEGA
jgi:hypothetical protein